jgi:hypothetical protein
LEVNIPIEESDHTEPIRRVLVHHPVDTALVQPVGDPIDDIPNFNHIRPPGWVERQFIRPFRGLALPGLGVRLAATVSLRQNPCGSYTP